MPEPPSVLVAIGQGETLKLPKQDYKNIFTEYNVNHIAPATDADFYNRVVKAPATVNKSEFNIYGFMGARHKYTSKNTIQKIVDFFEKDSIINVVICDVVRETPYFQSPIYIHPQSENNIPFFISSALKDKISFVNGENLLQDQLEKLRKEHTIFHVASQLISV